MMISGRGDRKKMGKLKFYFSFRSPYSWIAAKQLQEEKIFNRINLEKIPFWEPDTYTLEKLKKRGGRFLYQPMSKAKHLYILQDIKRMVNKLGYQVIWPIDTDKPWWDLPHLAYLSACRVGKGDEFFWAVSKWRWEMGENICQRSVVEKIAEEIGLDSQVTINAPNDDRIREQAVQALYQCYCDDVFGVPFFMNGYQKYWGVDRLDDFLCSTGLFGKRNTDLKDGPMEVVVREGAYDTDHPGGCG